MSLRTMSYIALIVVGVGLTLNEYAASSVSSTSSTVLDKDTQTMIRNLAAIQNKTESQVAREAVAAEYKRYLLAVSKKYREAQVGGTND